MVNVKIGPTESFRIHAGRYFSQFASYFTGLSTQTDNPFISRKEYLKLDQGLNQIVNTAQIGSENQADVDVRKRRKQRELEEYLLMADTI